MGTTVLADGHVGMELLLLLRLPLALYLLPLRGVHNRFELHFARLLDDTIFDHLPDDFVDFSELLVCGNLFLQLGFQVGPSQQFILNLFLLLLLPELVLFDLCFAPSPLG